MVIAQTVRFDLWCQDCQARCEGHCHVVLVSPRLECQPERVWKTVQATTKRPGRDNDMASLIARLLALHLKSEGVGVVLECRHQRRNRAKTSPPPLPVLTMAMAGRAKVDEELRKECLRYVRRRHFRRLS